MTGSRAHVYVVDAGSGNGGSAFEEVEHGRAGERCRQLERGRDRGCVQVPLLDLANGIQVEVTAKPADPAPEGDRRRLHAQAARRPRRSLHQRTDDLDDEDVSDTAVVLHVLEELLQHLGHAELTADVLQARQD